MEEQVIRLDELFEALKKRWLMIVTVTLIATIISAALSFFVIKPKYEASTKVFIGKDEGDNQAYNQNDVLMYQKLMKTYSEAIKTKDLVSRSLQGTSLELKPEDVLANLTVSPVTDTQILQIKYKSNNPQESKVVIQELTDEFIRTSKELVPNGNIKTIEEVQLPEKPVSPNKKMNIAIAFLLGLMVSIGLAFLLEFLDNTFKSKDQLERELDIPVIGVIPTVKEV
ncbi:capsular polysaccharide biosynthsis protein [Clostridium sartagoforme AAU1]|uniref:Capsular polysaccharide biosynthsis protein n=1 Tax=Clostridium sartagoforme AAU1 TaxID=1202534 RepID=R9CGU9_9CLOT|nr:Wzz/FepE/Etk N-terminal domain-containing protein [Clostridium sartagoforme]EOR28245.1 capsular polysaccharide biosynthsis protein [Clostridium sartagoforme AAU1]